MNDRIMAVFDLDGTLTTVRSVESYFFRYLLARRKLPVRNILGAAVFYFRNVLTDPVLAVKKNKMYLKNLSQGDVSLWGEEFRRSCKDRIIAVESLKMIRGHRDAGHATILITGTPDVLVRDLFEKQLFDFVYSTELEVVRHSYTGHIRGKFYYGQEKKDLVLHLAEKLGARLPESFCYADSGGDIRMMSLFGHPIAVHPDALLKRHAIQNNWQIMQ